MNSIVQKLLVRDRGRTNSACRHLHGGLIHQEWLQ